MAAVATPTPVQGCARAFDSRSRHFSRIGSDVIASQSAAESPVAVATVAGFEDAIVQTTRDLAMGIVNVRAVYDIDPIEVWHSEAVALVGAAAHAMCHHQGQGANSAILDAGGLAEALREGDSVKEALALYQTTRKPVTDELQRISRQGWSEDEINDVFPGQKPAAQQPQN